MPHSGNQHTGQGQHRHAAGECGQRETLAVMLDADRAIDIAGRVGSGGSVVHGIVAAGHFFGLAAAGAPVSSVLSRPFLCSASSTSALMRSAYAFLSELIEDSSYQKCGHGWPLRDLVITDDHTKHECG